MPTVQEAQVLEYFDDLLVRLELKERMLIRMLLALLEVQMLAFNGFSPKLFTKATPEERLVNLEGWEHSKFFQRRLVFMALRTLLLWAYVDSHEAEVNMGFVPGTRATHRRNQARALAKRTLSQLKTSEGSFSVQAP